MRLEIQVSPDSLRSNLIHLALALPLALAIGLLQWVFSDAPPWWNAALADLPATDLGSAAIGAAVGVGLLLVSLLLSGLSANSDWVVKPLAAIAPNARSIALLSLFAALFEEILFRAALVPLIGVPAAAVLFVAAHVGVLLFAPSKRAAAIVGVDLLAFGVVLGLLLQAQGIVACFVAHLVHNLIAFQFARPAWQKAHHEWTRSQPP